MKPQIGRDGRTSRFDGPACRALVDSHDWRELVIDEASPGQEQEAKKEKRAESKRKRKKRDHDSDDSSSEGEVQAEAPPPPWHRMAFDLVDGINVPAGGGGLLRPLCAIVRKLDLRSTQGGQRYRF